MAVPTINKPMSGDWWSVVQPLLATHTVTEIVDGLVDSSNPDGFFQGNPNIGNKIRNLTAILLVMKVPFEKIIDQLIRAIPATLSDIDSHLNAGGASPANAAGGTIISNPHSGAAGIVSIAKYIFLYKKGKELGIAPYNDLLWLMSKCHENSSESLPAYCAFKVGASAEEIAPLIFYFVNYATSNHNTNNGSSTLTKDTAAVKDFFIYLYRQGLDLCMIIKILRILNPDLPLREFIYDIIVGFFSVTGLASGGNAFFNQFNGVLKEALICAGINADAVDEIVSDYYDNVVLSGRHQAVLSVSPGLKDLMWMMSFLFMGVMALVLVFLSQQRQ